MDFEWIIDLLGESDMTALGGFILGTMFGVFAQRSQFCLRAAVLEFWHGKLGPKVGIWLLIFSAAVLGTQSLITLDLLDISDSRMLASYGSLSGAFKLQGFKDGRSRVRYIIGAVFMGGGGMLAGGCAVGAGLTGGSAFSITAWVALASMWVGAGVTDLLVDRNPDCTSDRNLGQEASRLAEESAAETPEIAEPERQVDAVRA